MARNTKKKLAIFAGTSKCLVYAEAKYCASEMPGEIKYYECSRTEYCCPFGCCVSPGLHFHHLWYYWILVIIMFLVCSGGGWWYRYWLQGRYRAAASAIPTRSSNSRSQHSIRGPTCQAQQARITYNSARNTVLLHRMWKGPQRNGAAPAYNGNATTSAQYQNMNVVLNDANCPYYQLYGPPPSYETVIAQTHGKVSNTASPEATSARMNLQAANVIMNPSVPQCFTYPCSPSRLNGDVSRSPQCQNVVANPHQLDTQHENASFSNFVQYCTPNGKNICVPIPYQDQSLMYHASPSRYVGYMDKSSDTSDAENVPQSYELPTAERYTLPNTDCASSSRREQQRWSATREPVYRTKSSSSEETERILDQRTNDDINETMPNTSMLKSMTDEDEENDIGTPTRYFLTAPRYTKIRKREEGDNRRVCGGSLRLAGRYADMNSEKNTSRRVLSKCLPPTQEREFISTRAIVSESTRNVKVSERIADASTSSSQSNPSSNVILGSFFFDDAPSSSGTAGSSERPSHTTPGSTNANLESKHRLDRSKSLE